MRGAFLEPRQVRWPRRVCGACLRNSIAAVGGALYVPQVGVINPSGMTPDKSREAVVWCAVGGRGTLGGPILGAI